MSDLIRREDAIEAVWKPQVKPNELIFDALKTAIESEINNVPSAERKGEWIKQRDLTRIIDEYHCSYCDYSPKYKGIPIIPTSATMLYCPNCGCRNRKE